MPFNPFSALTSKIFGGLAISLALALAVQTARIEGFLFFDGLKSDLAACETKSAQLSAAIDAANKLAEQARAKSVTIAKDADNDHKERSKVSRVATDRFVADRRIVRPDSGISTPEAGEGSRDAENPAPEAVMVAVSEADVRICAANYDYALTAFQWTQALRAEGLAD